MSYKIIGDSCMDCTPELLATGKIKLVPLILEVGGMRVTDDENFDQCSFLKAVSECEDAAKTACPSPQAFMEAYEGEEERVYCVTLSQHLSGSFNAATLGREMYYEEHEEDGKKIAVFSSDSASVGETLIAMKIMELEREGMSFEEVCEQVEEYIYNQTTYFVLDNLETLRKNGRLTGLTALVASVLNIKPLMAGDHGVIVKVGQERGTKRALQKMAANCALNVKNPEKRIFAIAHCNCRERAEFVIREVKKMVSFKDYYVTNTAGVSTVYANDGGIIVSY